MQQQATHAERHAYNAAFEELGLSCDWDPERHGSGPEGLRAYFEREQPHLLRAYDADFLVNAIESTKARLARSR